MPLGPRLALGLGDHSSIEVDAVVNNTVKISRVEKQGPQKILMGPKIKYMSIYSENIQY